MRLFKPKIAAWPVLIRYPPFWSFHDTLLFEPPNISRDALLERRKGLGIALSAQAVHPRFRKILIPLPKRFRGRDELDFLRLSHRAESRPDKVVKRPRLPGAEVIDPTSDW